MQITQFEHWKWGKVKNSQNEEKENKLEWKRKWKKYENAKVNGENGGKVKKILETQNRICQEKCILKQNSKSWNKIWKQLQQKYVNTKSSALV